MSAATTYINGLLYDARCMRCLSESTHFEVQTYLLSVIAGGSTDPATLATQARALASLSWDSLTEIKVYLLAVEAGFDPDPNNLLAGAKCFSCIPQGMFTEVQTYLLSQDPAGPGITDTNALAQAAKAFQSLDPYDLLQIQVMLIAQIGGFAVDPNALIQAARCMKCIPQPALITVWISTLDFLEPIPPTSPRVTETPPDPPRPPRGNPPPGRGGGVPACRDNLTLLIPVVTAHYTAGLITTIDILFPKVCCKPGTYQVYGSNAADMSGSALVASGTTGGSHGQANVTVSGIDVSSAGFGFYAVKQVCKNGLPVSANSNIVSAVNAGDSWAQRVVLNGGPAPSAPTISAINTFVSTLNAAGVWAKMLHVNVLAPDSLIAAETPLLKTIGSNDPYTVPLGTATVGLNGVVFSSLGNFDPGIFSSTDLPSDTDCSITVYVSNRIDVNHYECGAFNVATQNAVYMRSSFVGQTIVAMWNGNGGSGDISLAPIAGFHSWSRVANNNLKLYRASSTHPFAQDGQNLVVQGNSRPALAFTWFGCNLDGTTINTSDTLSFIAIGHGLTSAETQALYNAVQALRTAFGGGAV